MGGSEKGSGKTRNLCVLNRIENIFHTVEKLALKVFAILTKCKINWTAVSAVGTLLAVFWAIYHQEIRNILYRPVLKFSLFEPTSPHLVEQVGASVEKTGLKEYNGLFITIQLTNTGKTVAHNAQALLTKVGYKNEEGNWKLKVNWIAIPLQWVLGDVALERDLVPERPYLFNLGSFTKARDGQFLFTYVMSPKGQEETVYPGEYCFEITAFAEGVEILRKYFYVDFDDFKEIAELEEIRKRVKKVEMKDYPPW